MPLLPLSATHKPTPHAIDDRWHASHPMLRSVLGGDISDAAPCPSTGGEQAVWKAVITQALMDAASNSHKSEAKKAKREALEWLQGDSDDFHTVCEHAGLEPSFVIRRVQAALARGCQWRAAPQSRPSQSPRRAVPQPEIKTAYPPVAMEYKSTPYAPQRTGAAA